MNYLNTEGGMSILKNTKRATPIIHKLSVIGALREVWVVIPSVLQKGWFRPGKSAFD